MNAVERIAPDTIRMERTLAAPIETVWRWLVEPELRKQWFAGGSTDAREGGTIELVFDHDNLSADDVPYPEAYAKWRGAVSCETITRIDPPRLLAFTWDNGKEGTATFELFSEGAETRLVLTHNGISGPAPMSNFGGGWHSHLAVLEAKLTGGTVPDFWALHQDSKARVAAALEV